MLFFLCSTEAAAGRSDSLRSARWYLPHFIPFQFAGNVGFISTGLGYSTRSGNYEVNFLYGYVPASIGGHPIHTVTANSIFPLTRHPLRNNQTLISYLGLGLSVETSGNAFFTLPSHYPDGYYDFPKNLRLAPFGGLKIRRLFGDDITVLRGVEVYAQAGTIDVYLWYRFISNEIRLSQMFSLALGLNFMLDH